MRETLAPGASPRDQRATASVGARLAVEGDEKYSARRTGSLVHRCHPHVEVGRRRGLLVAVAMVWPFQKTGRRHSAVACQAMASCEIARRQVSRADMSLKLGLIGTGTGLGQGARLVLLTGMTDGSRLTNRTIRGSRKI